MSNLHYASLAVAQQALTRWAGDATSLHHLGNSASAVFVFRAIDGKKQILRLTDTTFRTNEQERGAVDFVRHLATMGCLVNEPVPTQDGAYTVRCQGKAVDFLAAVFTYIEGETVDKHSPYWHETLFGIWGATLGRLHTASRQYTSNREFLLWHWPEEILFTQRHQLIPPEEKAAAIIIDATLAACQQLPKTLDNYGIIHGDFGPQNFFFHPEAASITAIDFGNSCYHFFISDLANVQLWLNRRQVPSEYWSALLRGYAEHCLLPVDLEKQLSLFRRLRIQYIYLDRLYTAGTSAGLEVLRKKVLTEASWL